MRILITGCGGFIGGTFGRHALRAGHEVLGLARRTQPDRDWAGRYVSLDVASADLVPVIQAFAPDLIFHAAGSSSVGSSLAHPTDDLRASLLPWANLLDAVRRCRAVGGAGGSQPCSPLIVFPSSAAVYGNPPSLPVAEDAPISPISPYGFHKAACELLAREYATCYGLRIQVCRLFSVFGPAQRRLLVWELYEQFARRDPVVWLQGTGDETRDFMHVDDLCSIVLSLAANQGQGDATEGGCRFVNFGTGEESTTLALATAIRDLVSPASEVRCRGAIRPGDPRHWRADTTTLRASCPSWHRRPFREGLADCVAKWNAQAL